MNRRAFVSDLLDGQIDVGAGGAEQVSARDPPALGRGRTLAMSDEPQDWAPALEEIARRKSASLSMGGEARLARQKERGRLNARERIVTLFDPGTFSEIGQLVGTTEDPPIPGDALVAGLGADQRPAGLGRGRRRHRARWIHRRRRCGQALSPLPTRPSRTSALGDDARRRRAPGHRLGCGATARGPDGPGRAVGRRTHGVPRAGRLRWSRRTDSPAVATSRS